jgi:hypothetical protein
VSRICIHTRKGDVIGISGSERFNMGFVVTDLFFGVLSRLDFDEVKQFLPEDSYLRSKINSQSFYKSLRVYAHTGGLIGAGFVYNGKHYDQFDIASNTVMRMGSDAVKLYARIHGQCEIHCYVMPDNIEWFNSIVKQGLKDRIFREGHGWEDVLNIENKNGSPIVFSYSVCDAFPNPYTAEWEDDYGNDTFYDLPYEEQWDMSFNKLREDKSLEITPGNWKDYFLGDGISALDFLYKAGYA